MDARNLLPEGSTHPPTRDPAFRLKPAATMFLGQSRPVQSVVAESLWVPTGDSLPKPSRGVTGGIFTPRHVFGIPLAYQRLVG